MLYLIVTVLSYVSHSGETDLLLQSSRFVLVSSSFETELWFSFMWMWCLWEENNNWFMLYGQYLNASNGNDVRERNSRVVSTLTSYSGGPGFISSPDDWLTWVKLSMLSVVTLANTRTVSHIRSLWFPSTFFQVIVHHVCSHYIVWTTDLSL
jgi:hypothetical protein